MAEEAAQVIFDYLWAIAKDNDWKVQAHRLSGNHVQLDMRFPSLPYEHHAISINIPFQLGWIASRPGYVTVNIDRLTAQRVSVNLANPDFPTELANTVKGLIQKFFDTPVGEISTIKDH